MSLKSLAALVFLLIVGILTSVRGYLAADQVVHARGDETPAAAIVCRAGLTVDGQAAALATAAAADPATRDGVCESDRAAMDVCEIEAPAGVAPASELSTPGLRTSDAPRRTGLLALFARRWRAEYSAAAGADAAAAQSPSLPASTFSGS